MILSYLIMFDGAHLPTRIVVKTFEELKDNIERLVHQHGKPFEWIIRVYS